MIRFATADDAQSLYDLILALAIYEQEPDAVEVTLEELRAQLQRLDPPFRCLLSFNEGKAVGMALYFFSYSTWKGKSCLYLEDLFILPDYRRFGLGLKLMQSLAKIAIENDCPRMEWSVLNWNQLAIDFYCKLNAVAMNEWTRYRLDEKAIEALARRYIK